MKKIFALLLSLCMVLSSFVAVSAAEQLYNEGTPFTEWTSSANSDTAGLRYGTYNNQITAEAVEVEGRTGVHKMTAKVAPTSAGGIFYMPLKDAAGNLISGAVFPKEGTLTFSVDLMAPDAASAANAQITLRGGSADLSNPTASDEKNLKSGLGLVANEWKTVSGTVDLESLKYAGSSGAVFVIVRSNLKTVGAELYADNFTWTLTAKEYVGEVYVRTSADDIIGGTGFTVGTAKSPTDNTKDVVKASGKLNGYASVVGTPLKDLDGNYVRKLNKGDIIRWDIKMYTTVGYSIVNPGNATPGLMFRKGDWRKTGDAGPSGSSHYNIANAQTIPANQWVTIKGSTALNDTIKNVLDYTTDNTNNLNIFLRAAWATEGDIYFEKFDITVEKAVTEVVEEGWADPDWGIDFGLQYAVRNKATNEVIGTLENGVYTATLKEIADHTRATYPTEPNKYGENCGYQSWVKIVPNEYITAGRDLKVTFDLTTDGIINSKGNEYTELTVRGRFYYRNAEDKDVEVTTAYRPYWVVNDVNKGTPVKVTMLIPGDSYAQDLSYIGIAVDVTNSVKANDYVGKEDAYFSISNVTAEYVESELECSVEGENLVVRNTADSKYKFSGRLLAAEYVMVEDIPELQQFKEINLSDVEVEAGEEKTIAVNFDKAVTGTVKLFLWEPGSFTPYLTVK